jgi:hypothetical protein
MILKRSDSLKGNFESSWAPEKESVARKRVISFMLRIDASVAKRRIPLFRIVLVASARR